MFRIMGERRELGNPSFIIPLNVWEVDEVQRFLSLLNGRKLYQEKKDKLFWKGNKKGLYTVKASVALLENNSGRIAPRNMLWKLHAPHSVFFFTREVWWGRVLTTIHLKNMGFQMVVPIMVKMIRS